MYRLKLLLPGLDTFTWVMPVVGKDDSLTEEVCANEGRLLVGFLPE